MYLNIDELIRQIDNFLRSVLDELIRFLEQNRMIFDRIVQIVNNFIAWLEGLIPF